jgi:hypothetical protein
VLFTDFGHGLHAGAPGGFAELNAQPVIISCLPFRNLLGHQFLKVPRNNPVGQRAYDAIAKAAEGEIVSFTYDFPKPGTKAPAPKERSKPESASGPAASVISRRGVDGAGLNELTLRPKPSRD